MDPELRRRPVWWFVWDRLLSSHSTTVRPQPGISNQTKCRQLAPLGHLNYANCIITQAKTFLSNLLTKAAAIPSLYDRVILNDAFYTDAAPSTGLGSYYRGKWFASAWPPEFESLDSESRLLQELYPLSYPPFFGGTNGLESLFWSTLTTWWL